MTFNAKSDISGVSLCFFGHHFAIFESKPGGLVVDLNSDKQQIITWHFVYGPLYQPLTIFSPRAKALRLIIWSQVNKSGVYQNAK